MRGIAQHILGLRPVASSGPAQPAGKELAGRAALLNTRPHTQVQVRRDWSNQLPSLATPKRSSDPGSALRTEQARVTRSTKGAHHVRETWARCSLACSATKQAPPRVLPHMTAPQGAATHPSATPPTDQPASQASTARIQLTRRAPRFRAHSCECAGLPPVGGRGCGWALNPSDRTRSSPSHHLLNASGPSSTHQEFSCAPSALTGGHCSRALASMSSPQRATPARLPQHSSPAPASPTHHLEGPPHSPA